MKRTLLAALVATGALVSAQASAATTTAYNWGDENDTSWLPKANKDTSISRKAEVVTNDATAAKQSVRFGDENDASWLPTPAKR